MHEYKSAYGIIQFLFKSKERCLFKLYRSPISPEMHFDVILCKYTLAIKQSHFWNR